MKNLILALALLASNLSSDSFYTQACPPSVSSGTATVTAAGTTTEQTLFEYSPARNVLVQTLQLDLTALATTTTGTIKVYLKRAGGSYVLAVGPGFTALTGALLWTRATDADCVSLALGMGVESGGQLKVTATMAVSEIADKSVPYMLLFQ